MKVFFAIPFIVSLVISSSGMSAALLSSEAATMVRHQTRAAYDKVYPYYIEVSSMTQVEKKGEGSGGFAGHAFAYIKGICRDLAAPYPRVKLCEERKDKKFTREEEEMGVGFNDITNPNAGLGVSVNKEFENVNWVAVPGKELFFNGNLKPEERLTAHYMNDLADHVFKLGTHKGIELHPMYRVEGSAEKTLHNVILRSMDTDFAATFGRYLHSVKIPIKPSMLPLIVDYLNGLNDGYASRHKIYHWSGLQNNCSHFVHNLLAAIGYVKPKTVGKTAFGLLDLPERLFNLSIPANRMIDFAERANEGDINNVSKVYGYELSRRMLIDHDWLAVEPGVLVDLIEPHRQELNDVYRVHHPDSIMLAVTPRSVFDEVVRGKPSLKEQAIEMLTDPDYIDIRANQEHFANKFSNFRNDRFFFRALLWEQDFDQFREAYAEHVARAASKCRSIFLEL